MSILNKSAFWRAYSDLFQLLFFIVALVSLCYQIFKGKK